MKKIQTGRLGRLTGIAALAFALCASTPRLEAQWSNVGDLNLSGDRDVFDVVILASSIVGNVQPGTPPFTAPVSYADLNGDSVTDVFDVVLLAGALVGNVSLLPVGEATVILPGGVPLLLARVPAGTFLMGSPVEERYRSLFSNPGEQLHPVTLTQDYFMGKHEVTQGQWAAVMGTPMPTGCGSFGSGASHPVYCISWADITRTGGFLDRLHQHLAATGQAGVGKFKLPTEAQWERAARGGTQSRFWFGDNLDCGDVCSPCDGASSFLWWCVNSGAEESHPVGLKTPNQFGLYDVHGNENEWVADWIAPYPSTAQTDPTGPPGPISGGRVVRGCSWGSWTGDCRSAYRAQDTPTGAGGNVGFRLSRAI